MSVRRTTVLGAALVAIGPITMALYTPAMPELAVELGTTDALIKLTLTVYFAGFALTQLVCGPLTDAFGRKPVTIAFLVIYLASSVLATTAADITLLLVARTLQGIGAAVGITVSRALVRDQYTGQRSAQIMNTIGTMLALGPAISPTIGGLILELFGWKEIFVAMVVYGLALMVGVIVYQPETNAFRDRGNLRPARLAVNYLTLLADLRFLRPSLLTGFALGNIYTLATVLPFVLIHDVGLTPTQFGVGMMGQSLSFITGTLVTGRLLKKIDAHRLLPFGFVGMIAAAVGMAVLLRVYPPSYLTVMGPVALYAFAVAFILPDAFTSSLKEFPHIAGAASAMMGFLQFGGGILGSLLIAGAGNPLFGMTTIVPAMPVAGVALYLLLGLRQPPAPKATG